MKDYLNDIMEYGSIVFLAAFGGLVRYLTSKPTAEKVKIATVFVEIVVAIFAGLLVSFAVSPLNLCPKLQSAAAALAGYSSKGVLYIFESIFLERLKKGGMKDDK